MTVFQKLLDSPEVVIALCALLISMVSIFLTIQTLKVQKQHNLKSVRPIGHITAGDYEDDIYISIVNNGIGPLIIKELKVSNSQLSSSSLIDIIPDNINNSVIWTDFASNFINRALKPGDRLYLVRLTFDETEKQQTNNKNIKETLRKFFQHLTLELSYTDIYEKKTYKVTRKLEWFGRHFGDKSPHLQARNRY